MSEFHVKAKFRVKEAHIDFTHNKISITGYVNFNSEQRNPLIVDNTVTVKFHEFDDIAKALEEILANKLGQNILGIEEQGGSDEDMQSS